MKKIIFCTKYGLDQNNSAGGNVLRIKSSINALSKFNKVTIVSRNFRFHNFKKISFFKKNINFLFAPSSKKKHNKNFLTPLIWRFNEITFLKKDAEFLIDQYYKKKAEYLWISYASNTYNLIKTIKKIDKKIKIISDTDSVFYKFIERERPYLGLLKKVLNLIKTKYYKNIEKKIIEISDITTCVSDYDRKIFEKFKLNKKIYIFRNVVDIPNVKSTKKNNKFTVILSGTFGSPNSPMNVSTNWFLNEIYPLIKYKIENLKIFILGQNSEKYFKKMENNQITVTGWVRDIKAYFTKSNLAIVPLKYESGTRFKILEAGSFKIPIISTYLGAEGLKVKDNHDILLEDDPKKFAKKIFNLYKGKKLRNKLANNNYKLILREYTIKSLINDAKKILN